MITQVVAIKDRALDAFGVPFNVHAVGQAIRSFHDEVNRNPGAGENDIYRHPDDYDLYHLGSYDNTTGQYTNLPEPKQIAIGKNCKLA